MPTPIRAPTMVLKSLVSGQASRPQHLLPFLAPALLRRASTAGKPATKKQAAQQAVKLKKKKQDKVQWKREDTSRSESFPLCDAMRYIRAFEAGQSPTQIKFDLAVSLRTNRSSPVIRGRTRLPHPISSSQRIAVICAPGSRAATEATAAGASMVGEDEIFEAIRANKMEFERLFCHSSSYDKLIKSGIARILGPKGLMPNPKVGTVLTDVGKGLDALKGNTMFRERQGVVRTPIGYLSHTPEQLQANIRTFMTVVKKEADTISENTPKAIHEVVLSSTNSPGFPLSGMLMNEKSLETDQLQVV